MPKEIHHTFYYNCPADAVFKALMEEAHLKQWWTKDVSVESDKGTFKWAGHDWTVKLDLKKMGDESVCWKCSESNMQGTDAWKDSTMTFKLTPEGSGTRVDFLHSNYKDSPCYNVCSEGWKEFLGTSLKNYLETGKGSPYEHVLV